MQNDILKIGSLSLSSRLFLGTAQYPDLQTLLNCVAASSTELVTVAIRRLDLKSRNQFSFLSSLKEKNIFFLPNTAGCYTANEAVLTAKLAREALQTNRIKLEVIGDDHTLSPDSVELLKAAEILIKDGFEVFPYCYDDIVLCQRLADLGCVCVMPLASPIGSGCGIENPHRLATLRNKLRIPIVIDAGIGTASDACLALELGADAVLTNTAVAKAGFPVQMATAMKHSVMAGRSAYLAKRIAVKEYATASTSDEGKIKFYNMKM